MLFIANVCNGTIEVSTTAHNELQSYLALRAAYHHAGNDRIVYHFDNESNFDAATRVVSNVFHYRKVLSGEFSSALAALSLS